ncbi:AAA family ATPase [Vallitalea maricola]|uniref:AAA family ATPase n=1 Tax=Vallitalea maricola TaxID=3074433 RepID=A0ACB5UEK6_9FIRM|nr:AAA family ATPase [Vallitalea sp. AN17-2]
MSKEQIQQSINMVNEYLKENQMSKSAFAKAINVSPATLSLFLNDGYKAPHTVIPKIEAYLKVQEQKQIAPQRPDFQPTHVSKTVMDVITYCHIQGVMGTAYGDAGIGKTEGAREYCRQNTDAIMITISPVFANTKGVNELLCEELRITDKRTNMAAYMSIVRKLRNSNRVVIIDEAQHLTIKTLEHLRSMIVDDSCCGLVLIGNEMIYNRMTGKQEAQLAQLFSRIAIRKNVLTTSVQFEDMVKLFPTLGEEEQKFLYRISHSSKWGVRGAVNLYLNAAGNGDLTIEGLVSMAKFMGIGFN